MAGHQAAGDAGGSPQHTQNPADTGPEGSRAEQLDALAKLREPFTDAEISHRPAVYCERCLNAQDRHCSRHERKVCDVCGQNVSVAHVDLDFVGHAQATARLLEVDPLWDWEPLALTAQGLPQFDQFGGLWMRLTVCGMTRLGYGDAHGREPGTNAVKEIIGDGIRNAGMRFGMALDLWKTTRRAVAEPELTPGEKIAVRLREGKVWNSARGLEIVRQQAADEDVLGFIVEDLDWFTIGALIDQRLAALADIAAAKEARQAAPAGGTSRPTAGGAEHGGGPQARQSAADGQRLAALREFAQRVANGWAHLGATEMALQEARQKGFLDDRIPGPDGSWYAAGLLLQGRIAELRTHPADQRREAA